VLALSAFLFSLSASASGLPSNGGAADICMVGEASCTAAADDAGGVALADRIVYATPAEIDCQAAVSTVAVNSRADLQLDAGDCSPLTADYRFHVSRLPDPTSSAPVAAPQRMRKNARSTSAVTSVWRGIPDRSPPALVLDGINPSALVSTPSLIAPIVRMTSPVDRTELREGRGCDPPDEPPRV
jgi:hypothetical protein